MRKLIFGLLIVFTTIFAYGESDLNLERSVLTEAVENKEPEISRESFPLYSKAYFYTEFRDVGEERTIYHNWYYLDKGGEKNLTASVALKVKGYRWRTWSTKNLYLPGTWSVEVVDEEDNLITKADFIVE